MRSHEFWFFQAKNASETSATLAGRFQCDEDDYGYESREANSFYEKLMSKYEQTYEDPMDKFTKSGNKKSSKNLAKTLNKVKGALNGDDQEASVKARGHKRPSEDRSSSQLPAKKSKKAMMEEAAAKRRQVRASKPPPLQFNDLIKMAKQQQKAPPKAEVSKPEKDFEFERPMTKKEKEEFMRERESKLRRMGKLPPKELAKKPEDKVSAKVKDKDSKVKSEEKQEQPVKKKPVFVGPEFHPAVVKAPKPSTSQTSPGRPLPSEGQRPPAKKPSSAKSRPKGRSRSPSPIPQRRSQHYKQNYIGSDEEEDDYDSEMDDFIDDSDARIDISAEIRNIFKYDRRKFRDEDDFDDRAMENNRFSDLMKEEARSAKIGLMEDLEDMRREEEEKKRKKLAKKQRR